MIAPTPSVRWKLTGSRWSLPIESDISEYCSQIIHAIEANAVFRFNGNVPNAGLITNLPPGCNVEVPILVDNTCLHPCHVGALPSQLAAINRTNVNVQELAVKGFLEGDRAAVFQACALDPLTAATLSLDTIRKLVDALFEANAPYLDGQAAMEERLGWDAPQTSRT